MIQPCLKLITFIIIGYNSKQNAVVTVIVYLQCGKLGENTLSAFTLMLRRYIQSTQVNKRGEVIHEFGGTKRKCNSDTYSQ